jgi:hypothetical protein
MINDQEEERKIKLNRGMEFMLQNKKIKGEEIFTIIIDKVFSFLTKEFHLKFHFKILNKRSGKN